MTSISRREIEVTQMRVEWAEVGGYGHVRCAANLRWNEDAERYECPATKDGEPVLFVLAPSDDDGPFCRNCRHWRICPDGEYGFCYILTNQTGHIKVFSGTDDIDYFEGADWVYTRKRFGCIRFEENP